MNQRSLACLACLSLLTATACSNTSAAGGGPLVQDRILRVGPPAIAGVDGPVGVSAVNTPVEPWVGGPGTVRTTAEIMAEAMGKPAARLARNRPRFRKARPTREHLLQNPDALPDPRPAVIDAEPALGDAPSVAQTATTPTADVATLADTGALPPDTMGDIGPTQYLVGVNGRVRTIDKVTGAADGVLNADFETFFASRIPGGAGTSDPRVRYDRRTNRWFVITISVAIPNQFLVAVSNTATITPITAWTLLDWTNTRTLGGVGGAASCLGDYPTLGLDEDALYIGVNQYCGADVASPLTFDSTTLYVLNKSALTGGMLSVVQFDGLANGSVSGIYTPQGVDNFDANTNEGYFIGVDNLQSSRLVMRRVVNPNAAPSISSDLAVNVSVTRLPIKVPHREGMLPLDGSDDRLLQAVIRNGRLWTTHQMEVNASGAAVANGGRNGVRWYELGGLNSAPSVVQSGTVFDSAATTPLSYWMGTIMPNAQGHVAVGMSRAGANARVNAAYTGRLSSDAAGAMDTPLPYSANTSFAYNVQTAPDTFQRWGDYSYTSVDPSDDMTLWTLQQYVNATDSYAVRLTRLLAPAPAAITSVTPTNVAPGDTGVAVTVTGAATGGRGFFDPGASFPRRLAASFSGTGVTVTNVVVNSPTSLTLTVNTVGAPLGARTLTVTNPDGQTASLVAGLIVGNGVNQPPVFGTVPANRAIFDGGAGGASGPIAFTVSDPETGPVTMTATSSNAAVVPPSNITFGGAGTDTARTVSIATAGTYGTSTVTLIASDGPTTATTSFVVTVTPSAPPSAPQGLTAVVVRSTVTLTWQPPTTTATEPVSGYRVEAGFAPGETLGTLALGSVLTHTITNAPGGVFYVRLRAQTAAGLSPPSNEVLLATGQSAPPLAPQALLATVQGTNISLRWTENPLGPAIAGYYLVAGTAGGLADFGVLPLPPTARTFAVNAAPGTYFVRVVAVNAAGPSVASTEVVLTPGLNVCTIPNAPTGLMAIGLPRALSVQWEAAQRGAIPTGYLLQAGSVSGAANLGTVGLTGATTAAGGTVPSGPYFVRVFAVNGCGTSPPSTEVSTLVP